MRPGSVQERPTYEQMEKIFAREDTIFNDDEERKKVSKGYLDLRRKVDRLQAERMNFLSQWANKILAGTTQHLDITVQRQASEGSDVPSMRLARWWTLTRHQASSQASSRSVTRSWLSTRSGSTSRSRARSCASS